MTDLDSGQNNGVPLGLHIVRKLIGRPCVSCQLAFFFFGEVNLVLDYACTSSQSQHVLSDSIETIDSLHFRLSAIFSLLVAHYSWYSGPIWLLWRWLSNLFHKANWRHFGEAYPKKITCKLFFFFFSLPPLLGPIQGNYDKKLVHKFVINNFHKFWITDYSK